MTKLPSHDPDAVDYAFLDLQTAVWAQRAKGLTYRMIATLLDLPYSRVVEICKNMPEKWGPLSEGPKGPAKTATPLPGQRRGRSKMPSP